MKIILYVPISEGNFLTVKDKILSVINTDHIILDGNATYTIPKHNHMPKHKKQYLELMSELENWGLGYDNETLKVIIDEISFIAVWYIIYKLKRKRKNEHNKKL